MITVLKPREEVSLECPKRWAIVDDLVNQGYSEEDVQGLIFSLSAKDLLRFEVFMYFAEATKWPFRK